MGATTFVTYCSGINENEAFKFAIEEARHEYGHGGYTGTIAEKRNFIKIELPARKKPETFINELIENNDNRIDDKWGPAGCIDVTKQIQKRNREKGIKNKRGIKTFIFFGWASE